MRRKLNESGYGIRALGDELCTIEDFRQRAYGIKQRFPQQNEETVLEEAFPEKILS
jgi:hypothetical protein